MPLSQQELEYLQRLEAEISRRLASSNAVPTQPTVPQVEAAPVAGSQEALNQAVQESASVGQRQQFVYGGTGGYMPPRFTPGSPEAEEYRKTQQKAAATIARVGLPIAATMAAPVGIPAMMAYGAAGGLAGEAGAQAIEKAAGAREQIEPGKIAKSGVSASIPAIGPVAGTAGPLAAGALQGVKQAGINAALSAIGEVIQRGIDEGRLPTLEEIGKEVSIPAIFGAVTGGAIGSLSRGARALTTTEEQIAEQGIQAARRLEAELGPGTAPLTATQQTGRNVPGTFGPGSSGLSAQQALPERVRQQLNLPDEPVRQTSETAMAELLRAEAGSRGQLSRSAYGVGGGAIGETENVIRSILPRSPRTASLQEAANNSVGFIRGEEQRLSDAVDIAYNNARQALATRLGGQAETPVTPSQGLRDTIQEILGTLATEERITTTPSRIIGGAPTTTVERIPSQFFNEASSRARALLDVARSPQTLEQITGLRQSVDRLIHYFDEFAPGVAQNQLRRLRSSLKQEELSSARRLGVEGEIVSAQQQAERRFNLLQENPIIRKATMPARDGGYQNTEQFFSDLASSPAGFESVRNLLNQTAVGRIQFDQIRRGFLDSLRGSRRVDIGGAAVEDLSPFLNNFRELPQDVKNIVAGSRENANRIQSVLNDAVRVQNIGMSIPIGTGITQDALNEITSNLGNIASPNLRRMVQDLSNQARDRAQEFFNTTTRRVLRNQLNPDIDPNQFLRDFVLRSENPNVVQNALGQLNPQTLDALRANAATAVLNHVSQTGPSNVRRGIQSLEDIVRDPNRMQIIRDVMDPNDFNMINDYMAWNRARNLTAEGGRLQPDQLANSVMRATRVRWIVDSLVGNPAAQNFLASAVRLPRQFANLKPTITQQQANSLARASKMTLLQFNNEWDNLKKESDAARDSLPEDMRETFDDTLGVPERPSYR